MVDPQARRALASVLRRLATGRITNREFELELDLIPRADSGVQAVIDEVWYWYDDLREHRLELSRSGRTAAARCYLFLASSLPFEYPLPSGLSKLAMIFLDLPTLGLASHFGHRKRALLRAAPHLWPFRREEDLDAAADAFAS